MTWTSTYGTECVEGGGCRTRHVREAWGGGGEGASGVGGDVDAPAQGIRDALTGAIKFMASWGLGARCEPYLAVRLGTQGYSSQL